MLDLVLPDEKYLESVKAGIDEYKKSPSPFDIQSVQKLIAAEEDFAAYFAATEASRKGIGLKEGLVPSSTLWLINDGQYIGSFDIRHGLTEALRLRGGHIAYQIIPSQRRKGFVKAGLKLALAYIERNLGITQALLTCRPENTASYKAMISVMNEWGGFEDTLSEVDGKQEHRVWINSSPQK